MSKPVHATVIYVGPSTTTPGKDFVKVEVASDGNPLDVRVQVFHAEPGKYKVTDVIQVILSPSDKSST